MYPKGSNTLSRWTRDSRGGMETTFSLMLFHPNDEFIITNYEYTLQGIAVGVCGVGGLVIGHFSACSTFLVVKYRVGEGRGEILYNDPP